MKKLNTALQGQIHLTLTTAITFIFLENQFHMVDIHGMRILSFVMKNLAVFVNGKSLALSGSLLNKGTGLGEIQNSKSNSKLLPSLQIC